MSGHLSQVSVLDVEFVLKETLVSADGNLTRQWDSKVTIRLDGDEDIAQYGNTLTTIFDLVNKNKGHMVVSPLHIEEPANQGTPPTSPTLTTHTTNLGKRCRNASPSPEENSVSQPAKRARYNDDDDDSQSTCSTDTVTTCDETTEYLDDIAPKTRREAMAEYIGGEDRGVSGLTPEYLAAETLDEAMHRADYEYYVADVLRSDYLGWFWDVFGRCPVELTDGDFVELAYRKGKLREPRPYVEEEEEEDDQ